MSDLVIFQVSSGNQCHWRIWNQILYEAGLFQISQILTMVVRYMCPSIIEKYSYIIAFIIIF